MPRLGGHTRVIRKAASLLSKFTLEAGGSARIKLQKGNGDLRHLYVTVAIITFFIVFPLFIILAIIVFGRRLYPQLL
jgi:hypothetical protein